MIITSTISLLATNKNSTNQIKNLLNTAIDPLGTVKTWMVMAETMLKHIFLNKKNETQQANKQFVACIINDYIKIKS